MIRCQRSLVLPALLLALTACGCGGKQKDVSGTVTMNGKPLPFAKITLVNEKNVRGEGSVDKGKFTVKNAPVGTSIKVLIDTETTAQQIKKMDEQYRQQLQLFGNRMPDKESEVPEPMRPQYKLLKELDERLKDMKKIEKTLISVPRKYGKESESPLTVDTTGDDVTIVIQ